MLLAHRVDCGRVAESVQHDVGAFRGQRLRDAEADAAGGAGDDGDLALQHETFSRAGDRMSRFPCLTFAIRWLMQRPSARPHRSPLPCGARSSAPRWSESTHADTRLAAVLMRGPLRAFASASSSTPSHAASRQTRSRSERLFSPMPAVNTIASSPPSAAASEPSSRADPVDVEIDRPPSRRARRCPGACACRWKCPTRRAAPIAGR